MPHVPLTEDRLRSIARGAIVGDWPPYDAGDEQAVERFLRRVVDELRRCRALEVEADFDAYGSGYASYVDVFLTPRGGRSTVHRDGMDWTDGLHLYLCRLAPIAAYGPGQRTRHARGGSRTFLRSDRLFETPPGDWSEQVHALETVLARHTLEFVRKAKLNALLPFDLDIRTALERPPFRYFDALFHWED